MIRMNNQEQWKVLPSAPCMCMHITAQQGLMHNTSDCKNKMLP